VSFRRRTGDGDGREGKIPANYWGGKQQQRKVGEEIKTFLPIICAKKKKEKKKGRPLLQPNRERKKSCRPAASSPHAFQDESPKSRNLVTKKGKKGMPLSSKTATTSSRRPTKAAERKKKKKIRFREGARPSAHETRYQHAETINAHRQKGTRPRRPKGSTLRKKTAIGTKVLSAPGGKNLKREALGAAPQGARGASSGGTRRKVQKKTTGRRCVETLAKRGLRGKGQAPSEKRAVPPKECTLASPPKGQTRGERESSFQKKGK